MVCQKECINCGSTNNVSYDEELKEFYCDDCVEMVREDKMIEEFDNLVENTTDKQFWEWISGWLDEEVVLDIIKNWDTEVKENELINLRKITSRDTQEYKIEQHLSDILDEIKDDIVGDLEQIRHNVYEIREHLKDKEYI